MPSAAPNVRRLLIAWVAVWLLQSLARAGGGAGVDVLFLLDPRALFDGRLAALPGLAAYALGHQPFPELLHLGFNALMLWFFGPEVEQLYRGRRFWKLVGAAVAAGTLLHVLLYATAGGPFTSPVIGGSGVVSAMLAVLAAVYPSLRINLFGFIPLRMMTLFLAYLVLDLLGFLYALAGRSDGVAVDVHLAGAAVGWWWAGGFQRFDGPLRGWRGRAEARRRAAAARREAEEEAELDRILGKISAEGLGSLNSAEKRLLERRARSRRGR